MKQWKNDKNSIVSGNNKKIALVFAVITESNLVSVGLKPVEFCGINNNWSLVIHVLLLKHAYNMQLNRDVYQQNYTNTIKKTMDKVRCIIRSERISASDLVQTLDLWTDDLWYPLSKLFDICSSSFPIRYTSEANKVLRLFWQWNIVNTF